jgi:putative cell wall-binding protein/photosystem II stability/assembly factor-like uncharacterized protein
MMRGTRWFGHVVPVGRMRRKRLACVVATISGLLAACLAVALTVATPAVAAPGGAAVPSGFEPASVTFVSASDGWVLGTAPCSSAVCTSIVRTTDGGRNWVGIPAPEEQLGQAGGADGNQGLAGLRFADGNDGYAFGDDLWVTHDGGGTWSRASLPGTGSTYVGDLAAYNGYVYLLLLPSTSSTAAAQLYRSPVGDENWTSLLTVPSAEPAGIGLVVHGDSVWVDSPGANLTATLYRSTDDGTTWADSNAPCPGALAVGPSPSYVALGCATDPGAGQATKHVYISTDGGQTFTRTASDPSRAGVSVLLAVAQQGELVMASASGASFLYATFDGGSSWQSVLDSTTGGQAWHDLGFTTPQQGVAVEGTPSVSGQPSQLWMTRDGGRSWQPIVFANGPAVRIAGADRYGTAVAVSQAEYPSGGADAVVLARGDEYADAVVGAPLAAAKDAPLLLTTGAQLLAVTKAELQRVLAAGKTVYLLGGTAAIPASVQTELTGLGYVVVRYGGTTRYDTAVDIADALGDPSTALLATGENFPDALTAGPAAAHLGGAILLTAGASMTAATSGYLAAHAATVYAVGGPAAAADPNAHALVGADRYATAIAVASALFASPAVVGVATGPNFPDALSGGAYLAHLGAPLVLSQPDAVPQTTSAYLTSVSGSLTGADLFGGAAALSAGVQNAVSAAIR